MKNHKSISTNFQILQEESRQIQGYILHYILYQIKTPHLTHYAVEIATGNDAEFRTLGAEKHRAERLFEIVVNETVTPCTLREILYDAERQEDEQKQIQNLYKN